MNADDGLAPARQRLAARQEALMQALAGRAEAPDGFDAVRVRLASNSLLAKRARAAARAWPALAAALGPSFTTRLRSFAANNPLPARGGALADGLAFARSISREESRGLEDSARAERLAVALRYRPTDRDGSLVPRRGPSIAAAWLPHSRRWVVAVRIPRLGERWLSLPLGWPRG